MVSAVLAVLYLVRTDELLDNSLPGNKSFDNHIRRSQIMRRNVLPYERLRARECASSGDAGRT